MTPFIQAFLGGAVALASFAVAYFFFRFRKATNDRLFAFFAVAFVLLGLERIATEFLTGGIQSKLYLIRLVAFLLILFAILDKNRNEKKP